MTQTNRKEDQVKKWKIPSKGYLYRAAIFKCDADEKMTKLNLFPNPHKVASWLDHNKTRYKWRLYFFIDSVLREGFLNPVVFWGNIKEGTYQIHPGVNRLHLKSVLPFLDLRAWIVDFNCDSHQEYKDIFTNVRPLPRGPKNNRSIAWKADHRFGAGLTGLEDQYEFLLPDDLFVTRIPIKDKWLHQKWDHISREKGFSCFDENGKYHYDIGTPGVKDKFRIHRVEGVYQLMLHYFFDYPFHTWDKLYFRREK